VIVVDASAALEILLQMPAASRVSRRIFAAGETLFREDLVCGY